MDLSVAAFIALVVCVALLRLVELRISRRNQQYLAGRGARKARDPYFPAMVATHAAILTGAVVETTVLHRPFIPMLGPIALALFLLANAVRWWVIRTLARHWNVEVMDSSTLGVVASGPFRWVRHPNYAAVFAELAALPLIHSAWITAATGSAVHAWVLSRRIALEESVLHGHAEYVAVMAGKPRFLPHAGRIFRLKAEATE
jgi:methyltransferase